MFGHENMGIVEEVGAGVTRLKVGDRVSLPFNIGCGTAATATMAAPLLRAPTPRGMAGAAYGYAYMGPYRGGQAELLRVPFADFNLLELPEGTEHENDFTMLADIFPTGWHGMELSGQRPVIRGRVRRRARGPDGRPQCADPRRRAGVRRGQEG